MLWFFQCMDVRVGLWRKLGREELMLLNCGAGEDSWESLGLQGDPTSPFWRRSVLGVHWKDWSWGWNCNTLATSCEELTHWKRPWCWEEWGQRDKGTTEDEMTGWHHRLDGHEFEWTPGVGDEQGGLVCLIHGFSKSRTWLSNWTELNWTEDIFMRAPLLYLDDWLFLDNSLSTLFWKSPLLKFNYSQSSWYMK